ncbi:MAG: methionine--tRNA ligase [Candidatus Paceibacterota bacterium]|jgi:methionyl-tRNA synthetase
MQNKPFYLTTTLPYVNSDPHIGFALELIRADIIVRSKKLAGLEVFFNTGTDEHGLKIYRNAEARSMDTQAYVDEYAKKFRDLIPALGIFPEVNFIRTTDVHHIMAAQEFWKRVKANGYIYKKNYSVKYCVGCELEKTESELVNGRCPLHPLQDIEKIEEENYFFKFSEFQQKLLDLYSSNANFIVPEFRLGEIRNFVEKGLEDFSISRLAEKMPWGIPVPDDESQVMYVWFDALVNYISAVGWPDDMKKYEKWCKESSGMIQYCGKDNIRQQAAMWQAMLMAAGLTSSQAIVIDGFITGADGLKMSKSLGNTVDPFEVVKEYGTDALRYFVSRELSPFEDSPFSMEQFKQAYNAHLANGLGNLTSRTMKMAQENLTTPVSHEPVLSSWYEEAISTFNIKKLCDYVWLEIQEADQIIQKEQPFKVVKTDPARGRELIMDLVRRLSNIAFALRAVLPETSEKIMECVHMNKMPEKPIFVRK